MKKTLLLGAALFISAASFAQLGIGARAGANFSTLKSEAGGASTTANGVGLNAGLYGVISLGSFKIQPELAYSVASSKDQGVTTNLSYLSVPVLAKYTFMGSGFSALAGPQFGFLMSAKQKAGGATADVKSSFKSTDISVAIGAEFEIPTTKLNVGARYNLPVSDISNVNGVKMTNSGFSLLLGYRFK